MSRRPSDEHVRAIRFPVDKDKPDIFWLYCERRNHGDEDDPFILQYPETKDLLQDTKAHQALMHVQFNAVPGPSPRRQCLPLLPERLSRRRLHV